MSAASLLYSLDAEQHEAVTAPADAIIVLAGAGSGKTTVLTQRIQYRIEAATADAEHTLAITFTREAAAQLRRRSPRGIHSGTFHAIAFGMMRQRYADQNRVMPTVLTNQYGLVNEAIKFLRSKTNTYEALSELEWMQARALTPTTYAAGATAAKRTTTSPSLELIKIFNEYESMKKKRGVVDLGDLLARATSDIVTDREYADAVRWRYRHILVDEAQDMNPQQFEFFMALRGTSRDVFVVGDPLQAIYGWNGAEPTLFDTLAAKLGGAQVVRLVNNYRCSPVIVQAGLHVLTSNNVAAQARSVRLDGEPISVYSYSDEASEASGITQLANVAHRTLSRWSDIAVLVRTNTQRELIVDAMKKAQIPVMAKGTSPTIASLLQEVAALTNRYALADWSLELRASSEPETGELLLSHQAMEFLQEHPTGPANGHMFMTWYNTAGSRSTGADDGVEVLTFHGAKGREWHTVFIAGAEQGLIPHSSAKTISQKAEEVRVAYVAITRAAEKLYITSATERNNRKANSSKFFAGLPLGNTTAAAMPAELVAYAHDAPATSSGLEHILVSWRKERARALNVTETLVCSNAVLKRIEQSKPTNVEELANIVGPLTAEAIAPGLLPLLAGFSTNSQ